MTRTPKPEEKPSPPPLEKDRASPDQPPAGPHAKPELTNPDSTPGSGLLPDPDQPSNSPDSGSG